MTKHLWNMMGIPLLKYIAAPLFLIDFFLFYRSTEETLRGDVATNISSGRARFLGFVGRILRWLKHEH